MLVVNDTKLNLSSQGLSLRPGESKYIYGIVLNKAIKCSLLTFYPENSSEVIMINYNYPGSKIITHDEYLKSKNNHESPSITDQDSNTSPQESSSDSSNTNVVNAVFPELPSPSSESSQPPPPPKKRRGRRPRNSNINQQVNTKLNNDVSVNNPIVSNELSNTELESSAINNEIKKDESDLLKSDNINS